MRVSTVAGRISSYVRWLQGSVCLCVCVCVCVWGATTNENETCVVPKRSYFFSSRTHRHAPTEQSAWHSKRIVAPKRNGNFNSELVMRVLSERSPGWRVSEDAERLLINCGSVNWANKVWTKAIKLTNNNKK